MYDVGDLVGIAVAAPLNQNAPNLKFKNECHSNAPHAGGGARTKWIWQSGNASNRMTTLNKFTQTLPTTSSPVCRMPFDGPAAYLVTYSVADYVAVSVYRGFHDDDTMNKVAIKPHTYPYPSIFELIFHLFYHEHESFDLFIDTFASLSKYQNSCWQLLSYYIYWIWMWNVGSEINVKFSKSNHVINEEVKVDMLRLFLWQFAVLLKISSTIHVTHEYRWQSTNTHITIIIDSGSGSDFGLLKEKISIKFDFASRSFTNTSRGCRIRRGHPTYCCWYGKIEQIAYSSIGARYRTNYFCASRSDGD